MIALRLSRWSPSTGLLLLAELTEDQLADVYAPERHRDRSGDLPDLGALRAGLERVDRSGFAVNQERSERGLVAVGVPVREEGGRAVAGLSVSMPSVRYDSHRLPPLVATLNAAARALETDLAPGPAPGR
ncbi:IclR family transcriptional regulator C-terminal domain-containing protein [Streptomyces sp. NPDC006617]|uniref:IclR family transcriptional regulator domain-containing protein n=1 Tax=Streptomyces sp. NPDC006617 TaxID=3155354 RepID=UPI0033B0BAB2